MKSTRSRLASIGIAAGLIAACGTSVALPPSGSPSAAPSAPARAEMEITIYLARERLDPVGVVLRVEAGDSTADRVHRRILALRVGPLSGPYASFNVARIAYPPLRAVTVNGTLATLDFTVDARGWGLTAPGHVGAYVQQLVYTATEEPGVEALALTMNGGLPAVIEGVRFDRPLTRDNVLLPPPDPGTVWFARDLGLPLPVFAEGAGIGTTPAERIRSRIGSLVSGPTPVVPEGTFNTLPLLEARLVGVRVDGDLAVLDFAPGADDWGLHGAAALLAFIQQIVFTVTEEPGIVRVLITERGGVAVIGGEGLIVDRPITRNELIRNAYPPEEAREK